MQTQTKPDPIKEAFDKLIKDPSEDLYGLRQDLYEIALDSFRVGYLAGFERAQEVTLEVLQKQQREVSR